MTAVCAWCSAPVEPTSSRGRRREYCSDNHRVSATRHRGAQEFLYRAYDEDGRLLYVGKTKHLPERLASHNQSQPWWHRVRRIDLEPVEDGVTAELDEPVEDGVTAELDAIRAETPLHNDYGVLRRDPIRR